MTCLNLGCILENRNREKDVMSKGIEDRLTLRAKKGRELVDTRI